MRKFIPLQKGHRQARGEATSDLGPIDAQTEVDPVGLHHTESTPDLGIGSSTRPTPGPLASRDQKSSDRKTASDMIRSVFGTGSKKNLTGSSDDTIDPRAMTKSKSNLKSLASSGAKFILRGVKESADVFPPLKSAAGALCFILDNCEGAVACHQMIESLTPRVQELARLLGGPVPDGEDKENERRGILGRKLDNILQELTPLAQRGKVTRFLANTSDMEKLGGLVEDIRDALMGYQTLLQQDIYEKNCRLIERADLALLDRMYHVTDAGYLCGDRQGCMKGTRRDVLSLLESWLDDEQDKRVFWLNGLAGTGKSTIAQTFAEMSFADGKLGASFFCSRDFDDRSNLRSILPTLAFQLAYQYPHFREALLPVLTANPNVGRESLCSQMEKLIIGPFRTTQIRTLIVIDALDECKDQEPSSALLSVLSRYLDEISLVKLFITGRPEPRIRLGFRLESLRPHTEVLRLHEVKPASVNSDVRLFLKTRSTDIAKNRSDCSFGEDWPGPHNIDVLCKKAAGFFIYASTAVKFIASPYHPPDERLSLITSLPQDTFHEGRTGVDLLYTQVLEEAFKDVDSSDHSLYSRLKSVVGVVVLVFHPLSVRTLSDLLGNCGTPSRVSNSLRTLHSFLLVPESMEDPVHIFHKSFPDFLTDGNRCTNTHFFIDPSIHHKEILLSCLTIMDGRLKRDICDLGDIADLSKVEDLPRLRTTHIGSALEYACKYWTSHLAKVPSSGNNFEQVTRTVDEFFMTNFLYWIEVLVLTGNLEIAIYALDDIEQWYTVVGAACKWTSCAKHFILENVDILLEAPSHIYISALDLCPSSSWLYQHYSGGFSQGIKVVGPAEWRASTRIISCDSNILTCKNNIIASGSIGQENITILNAITGSQIAILSEHRGGIYSVTFSLDGTLVVSGSGDKTVKLWDIQTGGAIKTFYGHTARVFSVSISADNSVIASGSEDMTIHLWNVRTGDYRTMEGHTGWVTAVTFFPKNPELLLSSSVDYTVRQWGVHGRCIGPPITGTYLAFSPDGTQFILCCGAVTIRDAYRGDILATFPSDLRYPKYCCFSPDGKLVAFGVDNVVHLWDLNGPDPHFVKTFVEHKKSLTSLVFSSPHTLISASSDGKIKFLQLCHPSADPVAPNIDAISSISAPIKAVSLQAKDGLAFSMDLNGVVKSWDISTGQFKQSFTTPAKYIGHGDIQLISSNLIVVWCDNSRWVYKVFAWGIRGDQIQVINTPSCLTKGLRISGDGSRVFHICDTDGSQSIRVWSLHTGESLHNLVFGHTSSGYALNPLRIDGSKILICIFDSIFCGWDFGALGSTPLRLSKTSVYKYPVDFVSIPEGYIPTPIVKIKNGVTRKQVFLLPDRYANPFVTQWDGQYLITGYGSGEVLILDLSPFCL